MSNQTAALKQADGHASNAATPEEAAIPQEGFWEQWRDRIIGACAVLVFFVIWEWVVEQGLIAPMFISSPSRIADTFSRVVTDGTLLSHCIVSSKEFVAGYALAIAVGVPLGVAIGWFRPLRAIFHPFIMGLYATPHVAIMPLLIIWLGIGFAPKVAIVFLASVFPMIINMEAAMSSLDEGLLKASRSFGATRWQIFKTLAMPASVPYLISGLRLALGHALIAIVIGEMMAATAGLGYMITVAGATFRTDEVFVGVAVLATISISLNALFLAVERRFDAWRPSNRS